VTALVMEPVWSHFQNLCINYNIGQLNKSALNTTNLKYKALILSILFYNFFRIWVIRICLEFGIWSLELN